MGEKQRKGVLVERPYCRLSESELKIIDGASREILEDTGLFSYNREVGDIFKKAGAKTEEKDRYVHIKIPPALIDRILETTPSKIVLGARNPENKLILDAYEPRVRFGSGAETNIWLDVDFKNTSPVYTRKDGAIKHLVKAAHLSEYMENLDFFIRCVNIRDKELTVENHDINKFYVSANNITKHIQAGLTDIKALNEVVKLGEIIAGGKDAFKKNPVFSFISSVIKSPLQIEDDTATSLIEISKKGIPVVISSCPMGGATGPFDEFGMVVQINAELLAGVAINQLVSPGAPVLYGSVPVRTRLDNLNDMYGAPEFNHYNVDCVQMARFYGIPCYSTAGVGDISLPGIQTTAEKMLTLMGVPVAGPQYVHYAFGLLERTNVFCPEQAIIDNEHIGMVKYSLKAPDISEERKREVLALIKEILSTDHKTYIYQLPLPTKEKVYVRYPLESDRGDALYAAHKRYEEILEMPRKTLNMDVQEEIKSKIKGILPQSFL
jgi:trimethylamine---corrinoid protein Co-methyltransferase